MGRPESIASITFHDDAAVSCRKGGKELAMRNTPRRRIPASSRRTILQMSYSTPDTEPSMTLWCAGLPFASLRDLSSEEIGILLSEIGSCRLRTVVLICALPVTLLLSFSLTFIVGMLRTPQDLLFQLTDLFALLLLCIGIPVQLILGWRWAQRWRNLGLDMRSGRVQRFEGVLDEAFPLDHTQKNLLAARLLLLDATHVQWVEVLPSSRMVWRVNGQSPRSWVGAIASRVASTPEFAAIAAQWLEP